MSWQVHVAPGDGTNTLRPSPEPKPPSYLKKLDHTYIAPPNPGLPSSFILGPRAKKLRRRSLNPGYLRGGKPGFVVNEHLQGLLDEVLDEETFQSGRKKRRYKYEAKRKRLCVALVDLSGDKLEQPHFAQRNCDKYWYSASIAKIAAMYAAHQLRHDLNLWAKDQGAGFDEVVAHFGEVWKAQGLKRVGAKGQPDLKKIFQPGPEGIGVEFAEEPGAAVGYIKAYRDDDEVKAKAFRKKLKFSGWMRLMVRWSDNGMATRCIKAVGFPFIASCLWQSGLYGPGGGLWLGGAYGGGTYWRGMYHGASALSCVNFLTLCAQGRMISPEASDSMIGYMANYYSWTGQRLAIDLHHDKSLWGGERPPIEDPTRAPRRIRTFGKIGYTTGGVYHDTCHLRRSLDRFGELRYVLATFSRGRDWDMIRDLASEYDRIIHSHNFSSTVLGK